jgi:hypothetical protein
MELHFIFWALYSLISFAVSAWVYNNFIQEKTLKSIATFVFLTLIAVLCIWIQDILFIEAIYTTLLLCNLFLMMVLYFHKDLKEYLDEDIE